jgi:hypothetical protein
VIRRKMTSVSKRVLVVVAAIAISAVTVAPFQTIQAVALAAVLVPE